MVEVDSTTIALGEVKVVMTPSWSHWCRTFALAMGGAIILTGCFAIGFFGDCTLAQITPDTTLDTQRSVVTPLNPQVDRIDGGAIRGANLFHSFQEFNVGNGRSAYFGNPTGIENILSRVTGTNPSNIFGKLGVLGNANLFLINPNGIIFGAAAQLDIRGSFFASTASSFKFPDGSEFSATKPTSPPLLTVHVTPGLQWGASLPGATIINTGNLVVGRDLTLFADKLDLQGQLQAGRDLMLLAQHTVRVRDSVTNPFLAQAGGNLTIVGNQGIDILALVHPMQTPFVSRGNLSLISDGIISLDARLRSGGSFSIQTVSEGLANMVSFYDPIISAEGDVDVAANYTGTSLLVESKGNIRFGGNINITRPDTSTLPAEPDTATLSTLSALIMRSGQSTLAYGGVNSGNVPAHSTGGIPAGITIGGNVVLEPFQGSGGIVSLSAASGNVSTQAITTNGGAININSAGSITTNGQTLSTRNDAFNGGDITLSANNRISTGNLDSRSYSNSGNAGNGGGISIFTANGSITTGDLRSYSKSDSGSGGNGGAISLLAANGSIHTGKLSSSSISDSGSGGNGGAITLLATNGINITGDLHSYSFSYSGSGGNGGTISLIVKNGSIHTGDLFSHSSSSSSSSSGSGGNGGAISLIATNGRIHTGNLFSYSSSWYGRAANGGAISLLATNGSIHTSNLSSSSSSSSGSAANGGAISLLATNGSIHTDSLYSASSSSSGSEAGGAISLVAANGSIHTGKLYSSSYSSSGSAGQGGNISLFATNTIQLLRYEDSPNTETSKQVLGGAINSTGVLGSGNITIVSNAPLALDNSVISSDTFGSGRGGDIHISAPSISLTGGAQLSASTHSSGQGGNITLIASESLELSGAVTEVPKGIFSNQTGLASIPLGTFLGGFIPTGKVPPRDDNGVPQIPVGTLFPSGVFTQTTANSTGNAGNINIDTGQLIIKDGAAIVTTTWGQGSAGNIWVQARDSIRVTNSKILSGVAQGARGDTGRIGEGGSINLTTGSLFLTDRGVVDAKTLSGNAGNIKMQVRDLLLMRNNSQISASAGTIEAGGDGGNISISAPFVVAVPSENSDIRANAHTGTGGRLDITANGIFGFQVQRQDTPDSDISASSRFGVQGSVTLNTPDVDPSRGLTNLPTEVVDASNQMAQNCRPGRAASEQSSFVVTGRGGLPPNPKEPLSKDAVQVDWVTLNPRGENRSSPAVSVPKTSATPTPLVEAQGWLMNAKGQVVLTANAPTVTPHSPWHRPTDCLAPRSTPAS